MLGTSNTLPPLPLFSGPRRHAQPDTQPKILKLPGEIRRPGDAWLGKWQVICLMTHLSHLRQATPYRS